MILLIVTCISTITVPNSVADRAHNLIFTTQVSGALYLMWISVYKIRPRVSMVWCQPNKLMWPTRSLVLTLRKIMEWGCEYSVLLQFSQSVIGEVRSSRTTRVLLDE